MHVTVPVPLQTAHREAALAELRQMNQTSLEVLSSLLAMSDGVVADCSICLDTSEVCLECSVDALPPPLPSLPPSAALADATPTGALHSCPSHHKV